MKKNLYILFVLMLFFNSCQGNPTPTEIIPPNTPKSTQVQTTPGYPAPQMAATAYPISAAVSSFPVELPKDLSPASNQVAVVLGRLAHTDNKSNSEISYPAVYLGEIKVDAKGNPLIASLDKANAPKAIIDQKGNFVFQNVKPGSYLLMVDIVQTFITKQTSDGKEQILVLQGGKSLDVGEIKIP